MGKRCLGLFGAPCMVLDGNTLGRMRELLDHLGLRMALPCRNERVQMHLDFENMLGVRAAEHEEQASMFVVQRGPGELERVQAEPEQPSGLGAGPAHYGANRQSLS